ncbi:protein serine/threonine phosphatase [Desulfarculus baarsii DSM 2075]|uniref:Protein serine/threonine phosphatase n=1 Tax=Desulfarculus baarsii (strain ATCC 33931 / DSM 2075 / LMG 7858 / VKM B-1802 / 2st14) TaxID=644282 RepID=E1QGR5_DESB2|nr:SpoIIE family protein phosphatase [Desulfarculus baarsii]ADK84758.1 protein serine/threonine phosphatase [Desulfarculus baarsii DSM 2075]
MSIRWQLLLSHLAVVAVAAVAMVIVARLSVDRAVDQLSLANHRLSETVLTKSGERLVMAQAQAVAQELARLLAGRDSADYAALRRDQALRAIATQDIRSQFGPAGYTDVYDQTGLAVLHPNKTVEGRNFAEWREKFPQMWELVRNSLHTPVSQGYYDFIDKNNAPRKKFMAMVHVPRTKLIVVAAVDIDSYFKPVQARIAAEGQRIKDQALDQVWGHILAGLAAAMLIGLACALFFAQRISQPVRHLAQGVAALGGGDFSVAVRADGAREIKALAQAFNRLGGELVAHIERLKAETAARLAVASEMKVARQIQESLLPSTFPPFPEKRELRLYAINQPAKDVAGDFYDFFLVGPERLALVMGDVSGKGVPAALFMTMTRTLLRNICPDEPDPARALAKANELLCQDNDASMFVTLFLAYYEIDSGRMVYANAGHNDPCVIAADGAARCFGRMGDVALGALAGQSYAAGWLDLAPGETLALYTDGITEAPSPDGREFGMDRFEQLLTANADRDVEDICRLVVEAANQFQAGERFDDVTIMLLRRAATEQNPSIG